MAKGFKHGAGGAGAGLNFVVVGGTTEPANPKENTIWVNTNQKITDWVFSATEPTEPIEGMVWIRTGSTSSAEFNALKKNGIKVYPMSAQQYISGVWVTKDSKIYQNGECSDFDIYLFNYSRQKYTWKARAFCMQQTSEGTSIAPTVTVQSDGSVNLYLQSTVNTYINGIYELEAGFDLTPIKTLEIEYGGAQGSLWLTIYPINAATWGADSIAKIQIPTKETQCTLDVSSISGAYKIGIGFELAHNAGQITFKLLKAKR